MSPSDACYSPARAFLTSSGNVSFTELRRDDVVKDIKLPCGQCIGCRLDRARDWSLRIGHECGLHSPNWFATMTYADENLPENASLNYSHVQAFYRALRKKIGKFRHFTVGEYGDETQRPHYHAILFGMGLSDFTRFGGSDELPTFRSKIFEDTWGRGQCLLGFVTPQATDYVARYSLKKVNGDLAESHYKGRTPEFCRMSSKPGIGHDWFMKYHSDFHTHDYCIRNGIKNPVPRYYDKLYKRLGGELDVLKMGRVQKAMEPARQENNTPQRLAVRAEVAAARSNLRKRTL